MIMDYSYSITQVAEITGGVLHAGTDHHLPVRDLLIDSRRLMDAEHSLFIALVSERNNGHRYISELAAKGVRHFLVSQIDPALRQKHPGASFVVVNDTLAALQQLAVFHRHQFSIPVIGITGSNGKTIVKEWLFQLMSRDRKILRSPKSYNSQIGVPLSVWKMNAGYDLAIFEAGISMPGEMEKLETIINPTFGILTNIGTAHDENFSSQLQKAEEKLKLFRHADTLVFCRDHPVVYESVLRSSLLKEVRTVSWGTHGESDLRVNSILREGTTAILEGTFNGRDHAIRIPFTDDASIENALHCWCVMLALGHSPDFIAEGMETLAPVAMRLELKEGINRCSLINDYYNSDLNSLSIALDFLGQQQQHTKRTLILSDIYQTGRKQEELYREIAGILEKKHINRLIGIGREISRQSELFGIEKSFFETTDDFLRHFPFSSFHDESILLKGARVFEFERISQLLQQKVHETILEINLDAIVHNLNYFRSKLNPGTKTMAMVKAFSYGSGSYEIANLLQFHRVDYLAVAYADEGVELRKAGISLPVMVMNPEAQSFDLILKYGLEPEIYNFKVLDMLETALSGNGDTETGEVKIHIKLDTGMHRLGFEEKDINLLTQRLNANSHIRIQSVFSHLAASEDPSEDDFTRSQFKLLKTMSEAIRRATGAVFMEHILNSAGASRFPEAQMDMVRLGIGLYGVGFDAGEQENIRNVSTLKTTISQIKQVKDGDTIGYNRKGIAVKDTVIAVIPIGYADGLNRRLGNGAGRVFIHGKPAPLIGNICMDICMADITEIVKQQEGKPVNEGEEVIVFGDDYPISSLARDLGTIPYEILTGISRRVKRVYFHE